ncbi:protein LSD1-like [Tripterygium wilfordii]|uniref:protein LSD1-like n=1 Tax=Tripterygium wilfordii TaxID=458696 RepID=UPI0018F832C7|nr:protein LSD1-like [Tripterygium wilfordii]
MQSQHVCGGCRSILLYPRGAANIICTRCNIVTSFAPPGMEMFQIICGVCRALLSYARGDTIVRCLYCHAMNLAPGKTKASNQVAHVNCRNCRMTLMYPYGAPSVKCAVCQYVTFFDCFEQVLDKNTKGFLLLMMNMRSKYSVSLMGVDEPMIMLIRYFLFLLVGAFFYDNFGDGDAISSFIDCRGNARIPLLANRPNVAVDSNAIPHASTVTTQSQSQTVVVENPTSVDESGRLVSNVVVGVATENKQRDSR